MQANKTRFNRNKIYDLTEKETMAPIGTYTILESRLWMLGELAKYLRKKGLPPDPKLTTLDPRSFATVKCLSEVNEACKTSGYPDMRETDGRERYRAAWRQCYALTENSPNINQTEIGQIANEVCPSVPKPTPATEEEPTTKPDNQRSKFDSAPVLGSALVVPGVFALGIAVGIAITWATAGTGTLAGIAAADAIWSIGGVAAGAALFFNS